MARVTLRFLFLLALLSALAAVGKATVTGGWGDTQMANPGDHAHEIILAVKAEAEALAGTTFSKWEPLTYSTQVRWPTLE